MNKIIKNIGVYFKRRYYLCLEEIAWIIACSRLLLFVVKEIGLISRHAKVKYLNSKQRLERRRNSKPIRINRYAIEYGKLVKLEENEGEERLKLERKRREKIRQKIIVREEQLIDAIVRFQQRQLK